MPLPRTFDFLPGFVVDVAEQDDPVGVLFSKVQRRLKTGGREGSPAMSTRAYAITTEGGVSGRVDLAASTYQVPRLGIVASGNCR